MRHRQRSRRNRNRNQRRNGKPQQRNQSPARGKRRGGQKRQPMVKCHWCRYHRPANDHQWNKKPTCKGCYRVLSGRVMTGKRLLERLSGSANPPRTPPAPPQSGRLDFLRRFFQRR